MSHQNPSDERLKEILRAARTIAMVGASSNRERPSHGVMRQLLQSGYRVIPVNPGEIRVLEQPAYGSLRDIPDTIDIVDVFRRSEEVDAIADDAIAIKAKVLWLQLGIMNEPAAKRAEAAGLVVVMNKCLATTHKELLDGAPL